MFLIVDKNEGRVLVGDSDHAYELSLEEYEELIEGGDESVSGNYEGVSREDTEGHSLRLCP